jgi:GntR family transcriptional regulator
MTIELPLKEYDPLERSLMSERTGYRELAATLREAIHGGEYPPGSTLPKQEELATRFAVNVKTVRHAVALLQAEGLVTPVRRRGTVVRERPPLTRLGADRYAKHRWKSDDVVAFAADREASGRPWRREDQVNTVRLTEADVEVAEALGLEPGASVYERARLITDAGVPTHSLTSYYRPEHVSGTPLVEPTAGPAGRGGGFSVLASRGLEPHHITETLHARMPAPDEMERLRLPAGEPVMVLQRRTFTVDGEIVEFARGVHAASRFSWTYSFTIPE